MKNYVVMTKSYGKTFQHDNLEDAIHMADKHQKTRKYDIIVLEKTGETEKSTLYKEVYNAKGNPLSNVRYGFGK